MLRIPRTALPIREPLDDVVLVFPDGFIGSEVTPMYNVPLRLLARM